MESLHPMAALCREEGGAQGRRPSIMLPLLLLLLGRPVAPLRATLQQESPRLLPPPPALRHPLCKLPPSSLPGKAK